MATERDSEKSFGVKLQPSGYLLAQAQLRAMLGDAKLPAVGKPLPWPAPSSGHPVPVFSGAGECDRWRQQPRWAAHRAGNPSLVGHAISPAHVLVHDSHSPSLPSSGKCGEGTPCGNTLENLCQAPPAGPVPEEASSAAPQLLKGYASVCEGFGGGGSGQLRGTGYLSGIGSDTLGQRGCSLLLSSYRMGVPWGRGQTRARRFQMHTGAALGSDGLCPGGHRMSVTGPVLSCTLNECYRV